MQFDSFSSKIVGHNSYIAAYFTDRLSDFIKPVY